MCWISARRLCVDVERAVGVRGGVYVVVFVALDTSCVSFGNDMVLRSLRMAAMVSVSVSVTCFDLNLIIDVFCESEP